MIDFETLCRQLNDTEPRDIRRWIDNGWIRPDGAPEHYLFRDIDIARIHLIIDLRDTMDIDEPALPTVLSLLDQLYEMRRRMSRINNTLTSLPDNVRSAVLDKFG